MRGKFRVFMVLALASLFLVGTQTVASAQGRGRGGGGGGGRGSTGMGHSDRGRPSGVGVDRGINTSSDRSRGRADRGRDTASERSVGRSDEGLEHARLQRENARRADEELRDHPGMAGRLRTTANNLRQGYRVALVTNPDLKFGQYVAATRLAANLGGRHPNVTRRAILAGLAEGQSIGETLQQLGVGERETKEASKQVEREIKEAKRRP